MNLEYLDLRPHGRKKIQQAGARWIETHSVNHQIRFFDQQRRDQKEARGRQIAGNHQLAPRETCARVEVNGPLRRFDVRAELLERDLGVIARSHRLAHDRVALGKQASQQNAALDLGAGHWERVVDAVQ